MIRGAGGQKGPFILAGAQCKGVHLFVKLCVIRQVYLADRFILCRNGMSLLSLEAFSYHVTLLSTMHSDILELAVLSHVSLMLALIVNLGLGAFVGHVSSA